MIVWRKDLFCCCFFPSLSLSPLFGLLKHGVCVCCFVLFILSGCCVVMCEKKNKKMLITKKKNNNQLIRVVCSWIGLRLSRSPVLSPNLNYISHHPVTITSCLSFIKRTLHTHTVCLVTSKTYLIFSLDCYSPEVYLPVVRFHSS